MFTKISKVGLAVFMVVGQAGQASEKSAGVVYPTQDLTGSKVINQQDDLLDKNKSRLPSTFKMTVAKSRLSVSFKAIPLGLVLQELGRQANIRVYVRASLAAEKVSARFTNKPLAKGIKQLLSDQSYTLTYDDSDANKKAIQSTDQQASAQLLRIVELRLVSGAGPMIDLQIAETEKLAVQNILRKSDVTALKAKVIKALEANDTLALNDLMHQIIEHPDRETGMLAFNQAKKEHEANRETRFGKSTDSTDKKPALAVSDTELSSETAVKEGTGNATAIEMMALGALEANDPYALNEIMLQVTNFPDQQAALEAFAAAARVNSANRGRPTLR